MSKFTIFSFTTTNIHFNKRVFVNLLNHLNLDFKWVLHFNSNQLKNPFKHWTSTRINGFELQQNVLSTYSSYCDEFTINRYSRCPKLKHNHSMAYISFVSSQVSISTKGPFDPQLRTGWKNVKYSLTPLWLLDWRAMRVMFAIFCSTTRSPYV